MTTNKTMTSDIYSDIDQLARAATAGTLKRIYTASCNENIRRLRSNLQRDYSIFDNNLPDTISDAYDCHLIAYEYLLEKFNEGLTADSIITITLKNGTDKTRTVFQWACVKVRKYIYSNKAIENNGKCKCVFIEDLTSGADDTAADALDREYIKLGKYSHIANEGNFGVTGNYEDYITYKEMIKALQLTTRQLQIVTLRMQGLGVVEIANNFDVNKSTIVKQLMRIRERAIKLYPDKIRHFDLNHI